MNKNRVYWGFTLVELMVWIAIISLMALWVSSIDFQRLSQNQKTQIELVKVLNIIEEARNNAMIWRGIGTNLDTPDSWSVILDTSDSWSIESIWTLWFATWSLRLWEAKNPIIISNMRCQSIDGLVDDTASNSVVSIVYNGSNAQLVWCNDNSFKKIVFDIGSWENTKEISVNAVTGIIETS